MADILIGIAVITVLALLFFGYIGSAAWAVGDAQKHGHSGGGILILFWLFGPLAALVWLSTRPDEPLAKRQPDDYTNADDALADAARLDQLGDWNEAIELYDNVAARWPEHEAYVAASIKHIREKQALGSGSS